jgi:hypothetical protein
MNDKQIKNRLTAMSNYSKYYGYYYYYYPAPAPGGFDVLMNV